MMIHMQLARLLGTVGRHNQDVIRDQVGAADVDDLFAVARHELLEAAAHIPQRRRQRM